MYNAVIKLQIHVLVTMVTNYAYYDKLISNLKGATVLIIS